MGTFLHVRRLFLIPLLVAPALLTLSNGQAPPTKAPSPPPEASRTLHITADQAARLAKDARQSLSAEIAPGLEVTLWAPEQLVVDPVAIDLDARGSAYVTGSSRNNLPLDIRQHPTWVPVVHTLRTVEDLRAFYRRELSPERSGENGWLPDLNNDGSRDLRDFLELKERVYRIEDTDGDGLADTSHILVEGFNDDPVFDVAGGILYHDGDLIVGVPPGVYRLRSSNGDSRIDGREVISEGYNVHPAFGGHGISGVTIGPDGRLYWEVGDMGLNVTSKEGKHYAYPNQGAVLRSEFDGSGFEVFATGIRNLQEFAFDDFGNLITVDNDGDHPGEYERLVYIPEGSDSGWRSNWQYGKYTDDKNNRYNVWMDEGMFKPRFEGQAVHIIPPIAPYHAGPSGMVYNPGTALSDEWRNHFFVSSFPGAASNARIYGFRLKEDGAGFALESDKVVLRGILTVGMKFGPDGALYLTDWITGWDSKNNGRLWKLDSPKDSTNPMRAEVRSLLGANFTPRGAADLSGLLRHADLRIRQKAQFELARRSDVQTLLAAAGDNTHVLRRVHALWGLGQIARKNAQHAGLIPPFLKDSDKEIRAQAAKLSGDLRTAAAGPGLVPLLKDESPRVRFFAAEALGRLAFKPAVTPLIDMLASNDDKDVYLRHAGALALSRIGDVQPVAAMANHPSTGVRIAAIVALRRLRNAEVARFLSDREEGVVLQAARAINDDGGIEGATAALARLLDEKRLTSEPLLRRIINANLRLGSPDALARVGAFAGDSARAEPMRVEAISAIGVWAAPSPLDRVDGFYIGQSGKRDPVAARTAILRLMQDTAKADASPAMKVALAVAAGRLQAKGAAPLLFAQLRSDSSAEVRAAALRALHSLKPVNMAEAMKVAFADRDAAVRSVALQILPSLPLTSAAKLQHLGTVIRTGSVEDQQTAIEVVGTIKTPGAARLLGSMLDDLVAGKVAPSVQVDLVEAVQATGSAPLQARLEAYRKSRKADTITNAVREGLLQGGNEQRGRDVFMNHAAAGCTRCHTLRGRGSDVGPNLTRVGATLTREQLLQALLEPNARIAPGFGTVAVTLRNGQKKVEGTLRSETDTHLVMMTGTPPSEQQIAKADVAEQTNPASAMPPMGALLKPREIRDVVEFLSSLKY